MTTIFGKEGHIVVTNNNIIVYYERKDKIPVTSQNITEYITSINIPKPADIIHKTDNALICGCDSTPLTKTTDEIADKIQRNYKQKNPRFIPPDEERCQASKITGTQCKHRKNNGTPYCLHHRQLLDKDSGFKDAWNFSKKEQGLINEKISAPNKPLDKLITMSLSQDIDMNKPLDRLMASYLKQDTTAKRKRDKKENDDVPVKKRAKRIISEERQCIWMFKKKDKQCKNSRATIPNHKVEYCWLHLAKIDPELHCKWNKLRNEKIKHNNSIKKTVGLL